MFNHKMTGKMEIKVLGTGCAGCRALYETVTKAAAELGIEVSVQKEEDITAIISYNVLRLPALVINGNVVSQGSRPSLEEVKRLLAAE